MSSSAIKRQIHVTCALPYANGPIHLGHMLEHIQGDIFSRYLKMNGHDCHFVCADDTHGTPIMIAAQKAGITPEQFIKKSYDSHVADFKDFQIGYDEYSSTNAPENKELCEYFYGKMKNSGAIHKKPVEQLYCPHDKMFLPDRFVKGICPKCKSKDQYGDSCDVCGATYSPNDLIQAACSVCGTEPIKKSSDHIFFQLNQYKNFLQDWLPNHTATDVAKKMLEWFKEDLRDWDISRDEPYFGFAIPGEGNPDGTGKKYFYVWVDAPMGYLATLQKRLKTLGRSFEEFWSTESNAEVYHFIGKDIVYFHTLFWPAMLKAANFRTPTKVHVHGHVMVNGEKMSKSKGTFIMARTYLNHLDPQYLRYYYATKLNGSADDMDLNLNDFASRVNSDLVGKIVNLASRGAQMLNKKFNSTMTVCDADGIKLLSEITAKEKSISELYEQLDYSKATTLIRELAESVNKYFDDKAPWKTADSAPEDTQKVLTTTLNAYRKLAIYLKPVLPALAAQTTELFRENDYMWSDLKADLSNHTISEYKHLASRIDNEKIKAMVDEQKAFYEKNIPQVNVTANKATPTTSTEIEFDDFAKVDLRIAKVIEAEEIKEADKLLRLKVELEPGHTKQIIAGIKAAYTAEKILGRHVLICANLKPRKMKFGISEGMVLAAGDGGSDLFILSPDQGAKSGSKVK